MSKEPFRNEVYVVDPSFADMFADIKTALGKLDEIRFEFEISREWGWMLLDQVLDQVLAGLQAILDGGSSSSSAVESKLDALLAFARVASGLRTSEITSLSSVISKGFESTEEAVNKIWSEISELKEWNLELVDQIVVGLEIIEKGNVARGVTTTSQFNTLYEFTQLASDLRTTQSAELLAELKHITEASLSMEEAVVELKKIKTGTGLAIGVDLDEEAE